MPHVVIRGPVTSTKIVAILRKQRTPEDKLPDAAVGGFIESMSIGIVHLKYSAAPPVNSFFERHHHPIVVRNGVGSILRHLAKPRVITRRNGGAAARLVRIRSEIVPVRVDVLHELVNAVIAEITDDQRCGSAEILLRLQAPLLILRRMQRIRQRLNRRRSEIRIAGSKVRQGCSRLEALRESRIGRDCILREAIHFTRRQRVARDGVRIHLRWVVRESCPQHSRHGIVEDPDSAAQHGVVCDAEWLPRKTETRRPHDSVSIRESLLLLDHDRLIVRLPHIVVDGIEWPRQPRETSACTNRIGLMVRAQRERKRQIAARVPLVLRVPAESIESQPVPDYGRKILIHIREVRIRVRWIYSAEKKRPDRLWSNLPGAAEVETVSREIRAQKPDTHAQFMFALGLQQIVRYLIRRGSRPGWLRI